MKPHQCQTTWSNESEVWCSECGQIPPADIHNTIRSIVCPDCKAAPWQWCTVPIRDGSTFVEAICPGRIAAFDESLGLVWSPDVCGERLTGIPIVDAIAKAQNPMRTAYANLNEDGSISIHGFEGKLTVEGTATREFIDNVDAIAKVQETGKQVLHEHIESLNGAGFVVEKTDSIMPFADVYGEPLRLKDATAESQLPLLKDLLLQWQIWYDFPGIHRNNTGERLLEMTKEFLK